MFRIPRIGEKQIVGADEAQASVWLRLVDQEFVDEWRQTPPFTRFPFIVKSHCSMSSPLMHPNCSAYPSASATFTSLNRPVESNSFDQAFCWSSVADCLLLRKSGRLAPSWAKGKD